MKNIIFYLPYKPDPNRPSGSQLRPLNMLEAFQAIGYNVEVIMGNGNERTSLITIVKKKIKDGVKFDFLYTESSTMPTLLTESHHLPTYPFLDFGFFSFCKNKGIPIGLFYRDIYWRFDEYKESLPKIKYYYASIFYKYDLLKYEKLVDKLYLPSLQMGDYVPCIDKSKFGWLPPGHNNTEVINESLLNKNEKIKLLYVGGIGEHYQLHRMFEAIANQSHFELIVCTRKQEWLQNKNEYEKFINNNIKIVHLKGADLIDLYKRIDIAMLFVKPHEYRNFAFPVKLVEYLGFNKPIIATSGTLAGKFVEENSIGWSIEYSMDKLNNLLKQIFQNPELIKKKFHNINAVKNKHTWISRAIQVQNDLAK